MEGRISIVAYGGRRTGAFDKEVSSWVCGVKKSLWGLSLYRANCPIRWRRSILGVSGIGYFRKKRKNNTCLYSKYKIFLWPSGMYHGLLLRAVNSCMVIEDESRS